MNGDWRQQLLVYGVLSAGALVLTACLDPGRSGVFQPYFGTIHPLLVLALVVALGAGSLSLLRRLGRFEIFRAGTSARGLALSVVLATIFGGVVVLADVAIRFPEDLNVPPPASLLFYPAIGFVVEIVFHTAPLAFVLLLLRQRLRPEIDSLKMDRGLWFGIVLVSLLEPSFQLSFEEQPISWAGAFVWVHLFAFNFCQLYLFKRYDFVTMYSFRLTYYLIWHVVWGIIRLKVLF